MNRDLIAAILVTSALCLTGCAAHAQPRTTLAVAGTSIDTPSVAIVIDAAGYTAPHWDTWRELVAQWTAEAPDTRFALLKTFSGAPKSAWPGLAANTPSLRAQAEVFLQHLSGQQRYDLAMQTAYATGAQTVIFLGPGPEWDDEPKGDTGALARDWLRPGQPLYFVWLAAVLPGEASAARALAQRTGGGFITIPLKPGEETDRRVADLIKQINVLPHAGDFNYTPTVFKLIEIGEPALGALLPLALSEDWATLRHALTAIEGITIEMYGFRFGQGWPVPSREAEWRRLWKDNGSLSEKQPLAERRESVAKWQRWLAARAATRVSTGPASRSTLATTATHTPVVIYAERIHDFSGGPYAEYLTQFIKDMPQTRLRVVFWPNDPSERVEMWSGAAIAKATDEFERGLGRRAAAPDEAGFAAGLEACVQLANREGAKIIVAGDGLSYLTESQRQAIAKLSKTHRVDLIAYGDPPESVPALSRLASGRVIVAPDRKPGDRGEPR